MELQLFDKLDKASVNLTERENAGLLDLCEKRHQNRRPLLCNGKMTFRVILSVVFLFVCLFFVADDVVSEFSVNACENSVMGKIQFA